jgi:hypothetical protein
MFLLQHALAQFGFRFARFDAHPGLDDARAAVELLRDEVNRGAMLGIVRLDGAPMRMQSRIFGQQRGIAPIECA